MTPREVEQLTDVEYATFVGYANWEIGELEKAAKRAGGR
jgi:putative AlgH/UPF0301 family transcriptional regulator